MGGCTNQIPLTINLILENKLQILIYSKVDYFKVLACKVDFIQLAALMAGKKTNRKALTLEDQQRFIKRIGNRLKEVRKEAGYSAALDLAFEKELPAAQYARYEVGANMKVLSLLKALHALDISPAEFFKDFK